MLLSEGTLCMLHPFPRLKGASRRDERKWIIIVWWTSLCHTHIIDCVRSLACVCSSPQAFSSRHVDALTIHAALHTELLACCIHHLERWFVDTIISVFKTGERTLRCAGHIVFHGPKAEVLHFFNDMGFQLPKRKVSCSNSCFFVLQAYCK